jgi:hypothetical protein
MENLCCYTPEPLRPQLQRVGALGIRLDTRFLPEGGVSPVDHHDGSFLREQHRVTLVRPFIMLRAPSEGP